MHSRKSCHAVITKTPPCNYLLVHIASPYFLKANVNVFNQLYDLTEYDVFRLCHDKLGNSANKPQLPNNKQLGRQTRESDPVGQVFRRPKETNVREGNFPTH